jgi:hypothetical protein
VRLSKIGFDDDSETQRYLNGHSVLSINAKLAANADLTLARHLAENMDICFLGMMKGGPFNVDATTAKQMLDAPVNANGRPNNDVVKPRLNGDDITKRWSNTWIIDFVDMSLDQASEYEIPFKYVCEVVKPVRDTVRDQGMRTRWWLHGRSRPALRQAINGLSRYIATPEVSKYRVFAWVRSDIIPDHKLHVFAREDDYFFGVLHSRIHEVWSLATSIPQGDGREGGRPTYKSTQSFETFPFPWPPAHEPADDPHVAVITAAARDLVRLRDEWLAGNGPPELPIDKRTLTNLYNKRPDWLDLAHKKLDAAVLDAYGWPHDITDDEILARLLALNLARAAAQGGAVIARSTDEDAG